MRPASSLVRAAALCVVVLLSLVGRASGADAPAPPAPGALLDVPYLSQTPALCGGAAVAMVLRYWGERDVFAQDFASLVSVSDGGILTGTLTSAVRARGWQAFVVPATADSARTGLRSEVDRGRPLIALIEVAPHTYHYVVVVGSTDREVVVHDPARAPFRVLPWSEFDRAWAAAGRWMMLVLPASGVPTVAAPPEVRDITAPAAQTPCAALIDHGVLLARTGDALGAEQGLVAATSFCPHDAASWRELAGWRFSQSRWPEARDLALSAIRLAPEDAYSWQLVATSRYLMGDDIGALGAWNHTDEPHMDTIDVHGADRTRIPVVVRAAGLQPRQVLTPATFERARRRLRELPVTSNARMRYEPIAGGLAKVDVVIDERPTLPSGWVALAALGARALLLDEVRVEMAGPLGAGELGSAAWRWPAARPRVAFGLTLPVPQWFSGIVSLDGSWERQTYGASAAPGDAALPREQRRHVGLHLSDWASGWLRWQAGAALDRFGRDAGPDTQIMDRHDHLALDGAVDVRAAGDRLDLAASASWWASLAGGHDFSTAALMAAWRSTVDAASPAWSTAIDIGVASRAAPLALWQGAGTGQGRPWLLRAHPLLDNNVLTGPAFGRTVAHGSLEYARPVWRAHAGGLSLAGFGDAAQAWHRRDGLDASPLYVDAGVGIRVHAPRAGGSIRIDVAHGLRGGGTTLSASWGGTWPR
ncbi:MAG: C39 family peptidase [Vicinamibacterales bacterium]